MPKSIVTRWSVRLLTPLVLLTYFAAAAPSVVADDPALEAWITTETGVAKQRLFANISPPDCAAGTVVASPSKVHPDYFYHWVRDGALTMDEVVSLYEQAPNDPTLQTLKDYAALSRVHQTFTPGRNANTNLGEPKFLVSGAVFDGPWGRPQNDGPALRAMTLIRFARRMLDDGDAAYVAALYDGRLPTHSVIKADLEYVSHHWQDRDVDLWEETRGRHFYTRMAQHRALRVGTEFARQMNDGGAADFYEGQAGQLEDAISGHWDQNRGYVLATLEPDRTDFKPSQLDVSIILASLHTDAPDDPFFGPTDDRILATAQALTGMFRGHFIINQIVSNGEGRALQPGIGRYEEDVYDGDGFSGGNPWFLATAALAELCYEAAAQWADAGQIAVTDRNVDFLRSAIASEGSSVTIAPGDEVDDDPRFRLMITALIEYGDGWLRRIRHHCDQTTGALSEQFNRDNGFMQGAHDLTWSYAAVLTACDARHRAKERLTALVPVAATGGVN